MTSERKIDFEDLAEKAFDVVGFVLAAPFVLFFALLPFASAIFGLAFIVHGIVFFERAGLEIVGGLFFIGVSIPTGLAVLSGVQEVVEDIKAKREAKLNPQPERTGKYPFNDYSSMFEDDFWVGELQRMEPEPPKFYEHPIDIKWEGR